MPANVDHLSPQFAAMQPDWQLAQALLGGTRAMRAAGELYLPKWPAEDDESYKCRLAVAVLFPAYARTVATLAGKPFSKPVTIGEDVPEQMAEWLQNADQQGRNLHAFAAGLMEEALGYGLGGILVDYPRAQGVKTMADEKAAGLRPYFVHVKHDQIRGYLAETTAAGTWRLTQLRIAETVEEPDGPYATAAIEQVRVLTPGAWEVWRNGALHDSGTTTLREIPFVPVYGARVAPMVGRPPLIEVAHLNVAHWQSASDQQTILHVARVPILAALGVDDDFGLTVGAKSAVRLPVGADLKFVEHSGAAIAAGQQELDKLEERMRQAGAELLVLEPRITATQVATENAVGMCALQRIAEDLEDAIDAALQLMAEWVGLPEGGHVTIYKDFGAATLAEASAQLLLAANQAGKLSDQTFHMELQRRGILSPDVDWADEKARLDAQGPALGMVERQAAITAV